LNPGHTAALSPALPADGTATFMLIVSTISLMV
jgi:hypothetical protein